MALFRVSNNRAQFDAAGNDARDQYGAGIRFTQDGNARVTTASPTNYNQGIPMSGTGQVAIVDATAGLPAGTIFHNGLPMSGDKVCVSRNATAVVSNGLPFDSAGALAADINLDLNFIGTNTLNSSVTFTRASSATFVGSNGLIQSATTNTPRFDYDPVTLAAKGLLIEEQRTNLLTYSEQFDNGIWLKSELNTTGTPPWVNVAVAPDGTTTADSLIATGVNALHLIYQDIVSAVTTYTFSVYAKSNGYRIVLFTNNGGGNNARGFDLSNGTTFANTSGYTEPISSSITSVGNGWYRCSITFQKTSSISCSFGYWLNNGTSDTFAGNGTSGVYIWGAQLEAGSFATSYIPTVASQVTRSADVASVNTLSPWYNATEGTIFAEWDYIGAGSTALPFNRTTVNISDGTSNNRIQIYNINGDTGAFIASGGVTQAALSTGATTAVDTVVKGALAYATNNVAFSGNGATPITDASATIPTVNALYLGSEPTSARLSGHLRRITYYPRRLSNAELQAITA